MAGYTTTVPTYARIMKRLMIFGGLLLLLTPVESARIICVTVQLHSHVGEVMGAVEKLQDYGHELYLIVSNLHPHAEKYEKRGFKLLRYTLPDDAVLIASGETEQWIADKVLSREDPMEFERKLFALIYKDCECMMADKNLIQTLKNLEFDMAAVDGFIPSPCNLIIPEYLNIPFVTISTSFHPLHARIHALPHFVPLIYFYDQVSDRMTLPEKLSNIVATCLIMYPPFPERTDVSLLRKHNLSGTWDEIRRKTQLFVTTRNYLMEWPVPGMPHSIQVPGLSSYATAPISAEFAKLMDTPQGVIIMSFGSLFLELTDEIIQKFSSAFARIDQTVIWKMKFKPQQSIRLPVNVHIFSWIPQASLLAHPNTRLFITHCGNGGQHEALYHGVPMLGVPLFAEQHHNAFRMEHHGLGRRIDLFQATADDIHDNINIVLTDPCYKDNVMHRSRILRDRPMSGQEESAYWINHVIKFGGSHLRPATMDMSAWEFWMIDVILAVLGIVAALVFLLYVLMKCIVKVLKRLFGLRKQKTE